MTTKDLQIQNLEEMSEYEMREINGGRWFHNEGDWGCELMFLDDGVYMVGGSEWYLA